MKNIILTGVKPTGTPHLGNYFGAIKPAIELMHDEDVSSFYFIADYHALTTLKTAEEMQRYFYEIACTWLAAGLDPEKAVFYKQSDIPEVFELTTIFTNITPKGLMNRAHAYKAKVEHNEQIGADKDADINMGLYNYPILMASDIILFNTKYVPVGQDQKQHVEIARDIAQAFNKKYGKALMVPKEKISEEVATLAGLDGRKMSKSYNNVIPLFCEEKQLQKCIMSIKTDSSGPNDPKSTDCVLFMLYKLFGTNEEILAYEEAFKNGILWSDAKKQLFEVMNKTLSPMREKYDYYMAHKEEVDEILSQGAKKARLIAQETMTRVRKAIGARRD